jgi:hypothetical protein
MGGRWTTRRRSQTRIEEDHTDRHHEKVGYLATYSSGRNRRVRRGTGGCSDLNALLRNLQNRAPLLRIQVEHAERGRPAGRRPPRTSLLRRYLWTILILRPQFLFLGLLSNLDFISGVLRIASRRSCRKSFVLQFVSNHRRIVPRLR